VPGEGIAIVARGRDRAGMRFALGLARALGAAGAPYALMGPREAPWRTRTAVPKSIRGLVTVVPDEGPASWEALVAGAAVVLLVTDEDVAGPVAPLAMAAGRCVVAPRGPEAEDLLRHGEDGLVLPAYTREAWVAGIGELLADPARRRVLGSAAAARVASVDEVAGTLERAYLEALTGRRAGATLGGRLVADLRVRPAPGTDPARLAAACHEAGLDLVAVAAPGGIDPALAVAAAAPPGLRVVVGQEVACLEGVIVGLFLTEPVPDGLGVAEAVSRIRGQGGVVLAPHPETCEAVPPGVLRAIGGAVDCLELLTGAPGPTAIEAARVAGRMGVAVTAGSVASGPEGVGTVGVAMRPFRDARDFVEALAEGTPVRPRRTRRSRRPRPRARTRST
jgi:hypothetical protein